MNKKSLTIATCQFPVSNNIARNANYIVNFMAQAKKLRADIVHFSECAISGYAGVDFDSIAKLNWELLTQKTQQIMLLADQLNLWTILGSTHKLTGRRKPHNCLYLINPKGKIEDRYDKRFGTPGDLDHYTTGNHSTFFSINSIKCSMLICFDLRFPELYRKLKKHDVQCIFQSFYNARQPQRSIHTDIMRQTMQCRAATNAFHISMCNSSAYYSAYPSCYIQPDGKIANQLKFHTPGIMINTINQGQPFYDPAAAFRKAAMKGKLSNGPAVNDPRSKNRTSL